MEVLLSGDHPYNRTSYIHINATHGNASAVDYNEDYDNPLNDQTTRIIFIILYVAIFLCCFFGNLLLIVVVLKHKKMRTSTNFFLANLALADMCVGIFCVLPNLLLNLNLQWSLGRILCKLYYYIQAMCYTSSVTILTVISIERYYAIIHPMRSKQLATMCLLRVTVLVVWLFSAGYAIPYLIIADTIDIPNQSDGHVTFCLFIHEFNMKAYVSLNFVFCFLCPVAFMAVMYTRISIVLWRTTAGVKIPSVQYRKGEPKKRRTLKAIPGCIYRGLTSFTNQTSVVSENEECVDTSDKPAGQFTVIDKNNKHILFNGEVPSCLKDAQGMNPEDGDQEDTIEINLNNQDNTDGKEIDNDIYVDHKVRMYRFQSRSVERNQTLSFDIEDEPPSVSPDLRNSSTAQTFTFKNSRNHRNDGSSSQNAGYTKASRTAMQMYRFKSQNDSQKLYHQQERRLDPEDGTDSPVPVPPQDTGKQSLFTRLLRVRNMRKPVMHTAHVSRRKVIRLLMAVIILFALCVLPYHIRLLWQTFGTPPVNKFTKLLPPITFLVYYLNNAINPFLYAFLSDNFRRSVRDVMLCQQNSANKKQQWSVHSNTSIRTPNNAY